MRTYRTHSWIRDGLVIRPSGISGNGVFTDVGLQGGEVVVVMGGTVLAQADINSGGFKQHSIIGIDEGLWLGDPPDGEDSLDNHINHSCDPNLWMQDEVTLATRRNVGPVEELTVDYAMWIPDESWVMRIPCNCGSPLCRHVIRGVDWKLGELQRRYRGHFAPFINRRIEASLAPVG